MQADSAAAALGGAVVLFVLVAIPSLVLFVGILVGVARLGSIKRESVKQTELLRGMRSQLESLFLASQERASPDQVSSGQG